ncbi:MAG: hypothetical protein ACREYE_09125, partial [Gammaproteobacteria bacterium]
PAGQIAVLSRTVLARILRLDRRTGISAKEDLTAPPQTCRKDTLLGLDLGQGTPATLGVRRGAFSMTRIGYGSPSYSPKESAARLADLHVLPDGQPLPLAPGDPRA